MSLLAIIGSCIIVILFNNNHISGVDAVSLASTPDDGLDSQRRNPITDPSKILASYPNGRPVYFEYFERSMEAQALALGGFAEQSIGFRGLIRWSCMNCQLPSPSSAATRPTIQGRKSLLLSTSSKRPGELSNSQPFNAGISMLSFGLLHYGDDDDMICNNDYKENSNPNSKANVKCGVRLELYKNVDDTSPVGTIDNLYSGSNGKANYYKLI
jgi:hypothetical protein